MDAEGLRGLHDLAGRVAIVTGGTRGIGLAIAEGLSAAGAKIVVASRKEEACSQVEAHLRSNGGDAIGVPTHMGDIDSINALVERTVVEFGRIDIVVNNAANALTLPLGQLTLEAWDKSLGTNLRGPVFLVERARSVRERVDPQRDLGGGLSVFGQHRHVCRREGRVDGDDPVDGGGIRGKGYPSECPSPGNRRHGYGSEQRP